MLGKGSVDFSDSCHEEDGKRDSRHISLAVIFRAAYCFLARYCQVDDNLWMDAGFFESLRLLDRKRVTVENPSLVCYVKQCSQFRKCDTK